MPVRAKFFVQSKTTTHYGKDPEGKNKILETIKLNPVYGNSPENKSFYDSSPSGTIELGVLNPAASAQFEIGKEYYVDFTPAEV